MHFCNQQFSAEKPVRKWGNYRRDTKIINNRSVSMNVVLLNKELKQRDDFLVKFTCWGIERSFPSSQPTLYVNISSTTFQILLHCQTQIVQEHICLFTMANIRRAEETKRLEWNFSHFEKSQQPQEQKVYNNIIRYAWEIFSENGQDARNLSF